MSRRSHFLLLCILFVAGNISSLDSEAFIPPDAEYWSEAHVTFTIPGEDSLISWIEVQYWEDPGHAVADTAWTDDSWDPLELRHISAQGDTAYTQRFVPPNTGQWLLRVALHKINTLVSPWSKPLNAYFHIDPPGQPVLRWSNP